MNLLYCISVINAGGLFFHNTAVVCTLHTFPSMHDVMNNKMLFWTLLKDASLLSFPLEEH